MGASEPPAPRPAFGGFSLGGKAAPAGAGARPGAGGRRAPARAFGAERDAVAAAPRRERITALEGGRVESAEPRKARAAPKVIPGRENTWDPAAAKRRAEQEAAAAVGETAGGAEGAVEAYKSAAGRFEAAHKDETAQAPGIAYGLNAMGPGKGSIAEAQGAAGAAEGVRAKVEGEERAHGDSGWAQAASGAAAEGAGPGPGSSAAHLNMAGPLVASKDALPPKEELPEQASLEQYAAMPVEDFGLAMLRGMGWKKGMAVGRNAKGPVAPVEYLKRPDKLGLGADPNTLAKLREATGDKKQKRFIKPGEKRGGAEMLVAEGTGRSMRRLDEKVTKAAVRGAAPGKAMDIVAGPHAGLACEVVEVVREEGRSDRAVVTLSGSGARVRVRCSELGEAGDWKRMGGERSRDERHERERERAPKRERERRDERREHKRHRGSDRSDRVDRDDRGAHGDRDRDRRDRSERPEHHDRNRHDRDRAPPREAPWLRPSVVVRVVSKRLGDGKLYLQKGIVLDVTAPEEATLQMLGSAGGKVVHAVPQRSLETALPKRGGRVAVIKGHFRGELASLVERHSDTGEATVQLTSDLSMRTLMMEEVAEYVGDDTGDF